MGSDNLSHFVRHEVQFGFGLKPEVDAHLQRAAAQVATRATSLEELTAARRCAPDQLEVLVALYKFHFYQGDTELAKDLVFQTLIKASKQGGFAFNWGELGPDSAAWEDPRSPARIYLYSLKALAFIRLREDDPVEAAELLATLKRLDPQDVVGADVIRDLLEGVCSDD